MTEEPTKMRTKLARGLGSLYSVIIAVLCLLSLTVRDGRLWPLTVFDSLSHVLLLPAPILAILALKRRRWKTGFGLVLGSLCLIWNCGSWILPGPSEVTDVPSSSLLVVTWNLGLATCDEDAVAAELRSLDADVVLLQEARGDRADSIFEALQDVYPYRQHFPAGLFSKAYLSRIEPTAAELMTPLDSKNYLRMKIPFDGSELTISSMHTNKGFAVFGNKWWGYEVMLEHIKRAAAQPSNLVVGDFNLTERNAGYRAIRETGLVDSYRERHSDPGFTFPTFRRYRGVPAPPFLRIDYVWHTPDLRCISIERTEPASSDHCGLVARIAR